MTQPFLILANPRSRTAWLSRFLSYRGWECGHEQLRYARSLEDVRNWLSMPGWGSAETMGARFWRLIPKYAPEARIVTIRRDREEILDSLLRLGVTNREAMRKNLEDGERKLDQLEARIPGVKRVEYDWLGDEQTCSEIFEFCLPFPHDSAWWQHWNSVNVQINFGALVRYVSSNIGAMNKLAGIAKMEMLRGIQARPQSLSSIEISEESPAAWRESCQHLFSQHCATVEEHPGNWVNKNWNMFSKLHELGFLQIMIARSNGKAFGYLMTLLSPSLEIPGEMIAQHTTFFADSNFHGLGLRLQRAASVRLRERGVTELYLRAGVRGDGERMEPLYRRLGAEDFGKLYKIDLGRV